MTPVPDFITLDSAREWLRSSVNRGATCPCCNRYAQVYKRTITGTMASALIALYLEHLKKDDFSCYIHFESEIKGQARYRHIRGGDYAKLRYWGLIEPSPSNDMDALPETKSAGMWRITYRGVRFVNENSLAPKYAHEYDGKCLKLSGPFQSIVERLGKRFNYTELMNSK